MRWSKPRQIFDGGALGHDHIDVIRAESSGRTGPRAFAYEEAIRPSSSSEPTPPLGPPDPPPAPSVPGPTPEDLHKAERDAERREQEAFEKGRQVGLETANAHLERLSSQLEGAMQFFHHTLERTDELASKQALQLGLMVAEQLFRRSVEVDPSNLFKVAEDLIDASDDPGPVRLVVDPATAKTWRQSEEALSELLGERPFSIEAQPDLAPGDIIVHCGLQTLDERVAHRIRQYTQALEQALGLAVSG